MRFRIALLVTGAGLLGGCNVVGGGFLGAAGSVAAEQRHLFAIVAIVMIFVAGPVFVLTPLIAWHYRRANTANAFRPNWNIFWTLEFFIWVPPALIVVGLSVLVWHATHRLDPYRAIQASGPAVEVQVVALDWKWLFLYPDRHVAMLDRLVIPTGRRVHLTLTSGTVMQAFFVPRLAGQIYAMGGMSTQLDLRTDVPGSYAGKNTQYNGVGFARQRFAVVALPPAAYERAMAETARTGMPFDARVYDRLFVRGLEPHPLAFRAVPDGLYAKVLARTAGPHAMQDMH